MDYHSSKQVVLECSSFNLLLSTRLPVPVTGVWLVPSGHLNKSFIIHQKSLT